MRGRTPKEKIYFVALFIAIIDLKNVEITSLEAKIDISYVKLESN